MVVTEIVSVGGLPARDGHMTWGQRTQQAILDFAGEESYRQNILETRRLPRPVPVTQVRRAIQQLLARHEGLRTRYLRDAAGSLTQQVLESADVELAIVEADSQASAAAAGRQLWRRCFDPETEAPVRFGILRLPGGATSLAAVVSHLAADLTGASLLLDDLVAALRNGRTAAPLVQPVDRATFEMSDAGRELNTANVDRWTQLMAAGHTRVPELRLPGLDPRFWSGSLHSRALHATLPLACLKHRTTSAAMLLAALAAGLSQQLGIARVPVRLAFGNRLGTDDMTVESLMQWGITCPLVNGDSTTLIAAARREALRASATARYDMYDVLRVRDSLRANGSGDTLPQFFLNVTPGRQATRPTRPTTAGSGAGGWDALLDTATFSAAGSHSNDSAGLFFLAVRVIPGAVRLEFLVDTRLMTPAQVESLLRGMDRWVASALEL